MTEKLLALKPQLLNEEGLRGFGPLGLESTKDLANPAGLLVNVISKIIGLLTAAAIIWFVFQFIIGAFSWIGSSGDPKQVEAARSRIFNALIGLIIVIGAIAIVSVIGTILGIRILDIEPFLKNPATSLEVQEDKSFPAQPFQPNAPGQPRSGGDIP